MDSLTFFLCLYVCLCCFFCLYYCLKCLWLEVSELWDLLSFRKFTPKGDVNRKVQLGSFVDTTLLMLGEQHFLLGIKHTARNQDLLSPQCAVLEEWMG